MRAKKSASVIPVLCLVITLFAAQAHVGAQNAASTATQNIGGTWTGSYTTDGGATNELSYIIKKDEKNQWAGTLRFTNQDGEQTAEFKSLQIVDGKLKAKVSGPDGSVEVTIEGVLRGDQMEGTYSVSPSGTSDVVEKGTWRVTRKPPSKAGQ